MAETKTKPTGASIEAYLASRASPEQSQKPGGMCRYKVKLSSADEVDTQLSAWIRTADDAAAVS